MHRLEIEGYQDFTNKREKVLRLLKHYIVNKLKETEHVEFIDVSSNTEKIEVEVYDEIYRTVVGRMATDDLLYRIIKSFKKKLRDYDESSSIKIKDISINVEVAADFAGDKYSIVFEILNNGE